MKHIHRFWSLDVSHPQSEPKEVEIVANTAYWTMQPNGDWLAVASQPDSAHLVNMRTGETKQLPATFRLPAFSPDGTLLAAVTTTDDYQASEVTLYDLQRADTRVLGAVPEQEGEVQWSPDEQHLVALTLISVFNDHGEEVIHTPRQVTLFSRDGTHLGAAQLPDDFPEQRTQVESYLLTNDNQVVVTVHEGERGEETVRSLSMRSGAPPSYPTVWLPGIDLPSWIAIYVPPSP